MNRNRLIFCTAAIVLLSTAGCADPYSLSLFGAASPGDGRGGAPATLRLDQVEPDRNSQANDDDVVVRARFSEALAADQVAPHWMVVTLAGMPVVGDLAIDSAQPATLTFRPASRWPRGATISVALSDVIRAESGTAAQAESWSFSIRSDAGRLTVGPSQRVFEGPGADVVQMFQVAEGEVALMFDTASHGNCSWWSNAVRTWSEASSLHLWPTLGGTSTVASRSGSLHVLTRDGVIRSFPRNGQAMLTVPSASFVPYALARMGDGAATAWSAFASPANPTFASSDWNEAGSTWQQNPVAAPFLYGSDTFVTVLPANVAHVDYVRRTPDVGSVRIESERRDRTGVVVGGSLLVATMAAATRIVPCVGNEGQAGLLVLEPVAQGTRVTWLARDPTAGWLPAETVSTVVGSQPSALLVDAAVADTGAVIVVLSDPGTFAYEGWIRSGTGAWSSSVGSLGHVTTGVDCAIAADGDGLLVVRSLFAIEARGAKAGAWSGPTRFADGVTLTQSLRVAVGWVSGDEFLVGWSSRISSTIQAVDAAPITLH